MIKDAHLNPLQLDLQPYEIFFQNPNINFQLQDLARYPDLIQYSPIEKKSVILYIKEWEDLFIKL